MKSPLPTNTKKKQQTLFEKTVSHKQLVDIAAKWAKGRYMVVVKERSERFGEIPDVVGLNLSESVLIECKASRSDFHADKKKMSRINGDMVGSYRIYCAPKGLILLNEIPEGWGLLEVYPSGFAKLAKNIYRGWSDDAKYWHNLDGGGYKGERHLLFAVIRDMENTDLNHKIFIQRHLV